jgi:hypothetical protein
VAAAGRADQPSGRPGVQQGAFIDGHDQVDFAFRASVVSPTQLFMSTPLNEKPGRSSAGVTMRHERMPLASRLPTQPARSCARLELLALRMVLR